jgi:hypothetical protein
MLSDTDKAVYAAALTVAARLGHVDIITAVVTYGIDVNTCDNQLRSTLYIWLLTMVVWKQSMFSLSMDLIYMLAEVMVPALFS